MRLSALRRQDGGGRTSWLGGLVGVCLLVVLWQVLAVTVFRSGGAVPTPVQVARSLGSDGWTFYRPHLRGTLWEAARGYLWGNLVALAAALVVVLVPPLERVMTQVALASYCLPVVAVGPILTAVFNGDTPIVVLSALSVVFTTLIGALLGLRSADPVSLELVWAFGGGRWQALRRVRLLAMLPSTVTALKIAAPAALLGAIIGEYLGRVEAGLGVAMVIAQQQLEAPRTWSIALVSGTVAGLGYTLIGLVGRLLTPWESSSSGSRDRR